MPTFTGSSTNIKNRYQRAKPAQLRERIKELRGQAGRSKPKNPQDVVQPAGNNPERAERRLEVLRKLMKKDKTSGGRGNRGGATAPVDRSGGLSSVASGAMPDRTRPPIPRNMGTATMQKLTPAELGEVKKKRKNRRPGANDV